MRAAVLACALLLAAAPTPAKTPPNTPGPSRPAAGFRALSYNVAGIPVLQRRSARLEDIARRLGDMALDVVALQEVWLDADAERFRRLSRLPHALRDRGEGVGGNGLLLLSRHPILGSERLSFTSRPVGLGTLFTGETISHKGAIMARLKTPGGEVDVYDTHLVADYPSHANGSVRLAQIFELSEMVRRLSPDRPILVIGDLNAGPGDAGYRVFIDLLGLQDPCVADGREACGASVLGPDKRVDHILLPAATRPAHAARLAFDRPAGGGWFESSDHAAVEASLDKSLFAGRSRPDPARRLEALRTIDREARSLRDDLSRRVPAWSWIPVYGAVHRARLEREIAGLAIVIEQVATAMMASAPRPGPPTPFPRSTGAHGLRPRPRPKGKP